jgi:hypothetical protein
MFSACFDFPNSWPDLIPPITLSLEVVAKRQIAFESPAFIGGISPLILKIIDAQQAQADEKAQSAKHSGG